eukprot:Polyplicarium_translucidae@DN536_c0_g1_i1.p2
MGNLIEGAADAYFACKHPPEEAKLRSAWFRANRHFNGQYRYFLHEELAEPDVVIGEDDRPPTKKPATIIQQLQRLGVSSDRYFVINERLSFEGYKEIVEAIAAQGPPSATLRSQ